MSRFRRAPALFALLLAGPALSAAAAATYEVGPGQPFAAIGDVPWESLGPGDTVLIHWRPEPYKEKWVIGRQGTAEAPITVRGIPGPGGELPVVDGNGATTRLALDFTSETRGVIKIGSSTNPPDTTPRYIVIEALEIRGARSSYTFIDDNGAPQSYQDNASTIYVEKGEHVTVRGCILRDAANGFFVASSDALASRDVLVEGNWIFDNGNVGSIFEHNVYTAAIGITFQHNRLGPLCAGCSGNNLKDRSAGTVVRYNWIEGGNRQLDLVNGEDSILIRTDPSYHTTHVYGNVLIEADGPDNRQIVHYGGDTGSRNGWRKGTLHFYGNTVVSHRLDRTTLFRLSSGDERSDARNNVVYVAEGAASTLSLLDVDGVLDWSHNWAKPGWVVSFGNFHGTLNDDGTTVEGSAPGFRDEPGEDFHLIEGSACVDAGTALNPVVLPIHDLVAEYNKHQGLEGRPNDVTFDLGAYEFARAPVVDFVGSPASGVAPLTVAFTDLSTNYPTSWAWDFDDDGFIDSTLRDPNAVYPAPGTYSVQLSAANSGGTGAATKSAYVCAGGLGPGPVSGLALDPDRETLTWLALAGASAYDVVRGDLHVLRAGGSFTPSVQACVVDGGSTTSASDATTPAEGGASWYLVRGADCTGVPGTYGDASGPPGDTDAEIAAAPAACP